MAGAAPKWIVDTSSLIALRTMMPREDRVRVEQAMTERVTAGRLSYCPQVIGELQRYGGPTAPALLWAKLNEPTAIIQPSLEEVMTVLAAVPNVLDAEKDDGTDEADPYLLAVAIRLRADGQDARLVTEDRRSWPDKMALASAAGYFGVPSVDVRVFMDFEGIRAFR